MATVAMQKNTSLDYLYLIMYEQLITAIIFNTFRHLLLLRAFDCHSNRRSPKVEKICTQSFFKMISAKKTENVKKNQFELANPTGIHVDPDYSSR